MRVLDSEPGTVGCVSCQHLGLLGIGTFPWISPGWWVVLGLCLSCYPVLYILTQLFLRLSQHVLRSASKVVKLVALGSCPEQNRDFNVEITLSTITIC